MIALLPIVPVVKPADSADTQIIGKSPDIWGTLEPGPWQVGYTVYQEFDRSRTFRRKIDYSGARTGEEIARPIQISVWYPSQVVIDDFEPATWGDYLYSSVRQFDFSAGAHLTRQEFLSGTLEKMKNSGVDIDMIDSILCAPRYARHDAPAAGGPFPLVVYGAGFESPAWENAPLFEYLASHGYVVASTPSLNQYSISMTVDEAAFEAKTRDHEFVIARLQQEPWVDRQRTGAVGYSMGGQSVVYLAMRNFNIDAIVSLDGSMTASDYMDAQKTAPGFQFDTLRTPMMFMGQTATVPQDFSFFDRIRYANVWDLRFQHLDHHSFSAQSILMDLCTGSRLSTENLARISTGYETICRYTLRFFTAFLRNNMDAVNTLIVPQEGNRITTDQFVLTFREGSKRLPGSDEFLELVNNHRLDEAVAMFQQAWGIDPGYKLFLEEKVVGRAQYHMREKKYAEAMELLKMATLAYPDSWYAFHTLGNVYQRLENRVKAVASYRRSLELNPKNELAEAEIAGISPNPLWNSEEYLSEFTGFYVFEDGSRVPLMLEHGKLMMTIGNREHWLVPVKRDYFQIPYIPGYAVKFERNAENRIVRMITQQAQGYFELTKE